MFTRDGPASAGAPQAPGQLPSVIRRGTRRIYGNSRRIIQAFKLRLSSNDISLILARAPFLRPICRPFLTSMTFSTKRGLIQHETLGHHTDFKKVFAAETINYDEGSLSNKYKWLKLGMPCLHQVISSRNLHRVSYQTSKLKSECYHIIALLHH
jgi:hypothetical protein